MLSSLGNDLFGYISDEQHLTVLAREEPSLFLANPCLPFKLQVKSYKEEQGNIFNVV